MTFGLIYGGALFLIISLGLALMNRSPTGSGVEAAGRALMPETGSDWFLEDDAPPQVDTMPFPWSVEDTEE